MHRMMIKWIKRTINIFKYLILGIILLILSCFCGFIYIAESGHITPYARKFLNANIDGTMHFDTLFISFKDIPVLNFRANNGYFETIQSGTRLDFVISNTW